MANKGAGRKKGDFIRGCLFPASRGGDLHDHGTPIHAPRRERTAFQEAPHQLEEVQPAYDRGRPKKRENVRPECSGHNPTVLDVCLKYLDHAKLHGAAKVAGQTVD